MKIAVDAMGGDHAPEALVLGVVRAVDAFSDIEVILVGDDKKISPFLTKHKRISIIHTEEIIRSEDEPVRAVRRKKQASMVLAVNAVKEGKADACVSAGNTGALMTAGLFHVGRIAGIDRPALAPTLPTLDGKGFLLLDAGANMDAKPDHLLHYALMGSVYAERVRNIENPRVGLLNVGTEEGKGNELSKQTFAMLKQAPIHFIGNIEARDLLENVADVIVCDGFCGNLVLKTLEGTAVSLLSLLKNELTSSLLTKTAAALLKPRLSGLKKKMDYTEYGGAALFGLKAPIVKAHGSSNANAVLHTISQTREIVKKDVISKIETVIHELNIVGME